MKVVAAFLGLIGYALAQTTPYTPTNNIYGYNYDSGASNSGPSLVMNPNYKYLSGPLANMYEQSYSNALQNDQVQRDSVGFNSAYGSAYGSSYGSTGYNSGNPPVLSNQQQNQVNYQEIQRDQMYAGQLSSAPYTYNYAGPSNYQNPSNPNGYSYSSSTSGPFYDGQSNYGSSSSYYNPSQPLYNPSSSFSGQSSGIYQSQSDLKQTRLRSPSDPYLYYRDSPNPVAGLKGEGPLLYQPTQGGYGSSYGSSSYGNSYQYSAPSNYGYGSSSSYQYSAPAVNSGYNPYNYSPSNYGSSQQRFFNPSPQGYGQYESYYPVDAGNNQTEMYYPYRTSTNYNMPAAYTSRYNGGPTYGPFYDQSPSSGACTTSDPYWCTDYVRTFIGASTSYDRQSIQDACQQIVSSLARSYNGCCNAMRAAGCQQNMG